MTTLWQSGTTIARHVRVKGANLDPTLTQLRMTSLLNATDMQPAGLASSAIVCIRTLRTPHHVTLSLQHGEVRPPRAWEQSINAALEEMIRHAARPIFGSVPANSEAIVFNDTAELLACMTSDWCDGLLPMHWWWQSLFKTKDVTSLIFPTWLAAPAYVPTALQYLAVRNLVIPFVRSLSNDNARLLLEKLLSTFALTTLYHALYASEDKPAMQTDAIGDNRTTPDTTNNHKNDHLIEAQFIAPAPWQHIVPEAMRHELHSYHDQQCLLGIGLMLQRAPTTIRTTAFAQVVREWRNASRIINDNRTVGARFIAPLGDMASNTTGISTPDDGRSEARHFNGTNDHAVGEQVTAPSVEIVNDIEIPTSDHERKEVRSSDAAIQQEALNDNQNISSGMAVNSQQTAIPLFHTAEIQLPPEIHIDTDFGGLFYLINLALFLNLYSDFTTPMHPGIELPIWDFIALLGQRLLGDTIKQDPIWSLLAQLAERDEHDEPGKDFTLPAQWQFNGDEGETRAVYQWLNWLMPSIYTRLQLALSLDSPDQIAPLLCIHKAHARVTATHLDVFFALNTLPIEIRLAGLDRNPGWVPATGRFITFHFS